MQTNNTVMMNPEVSNLDKLLADYMNTDEAFEATVDPQIRAASRNTANELDDRVFLVKQRVSTWFKDHDCSSSSREVKFDDLVDFIEEQSSLVNKPISQQMPC